MRWNSRLICRSALAGLVLSLGAGLLAVPPAAAAPPPARTACDQLMLETWDGTFDGQIITDPNGDGAFDPFDLSGEAPASEGADEPVWRRDGGELLWSAEVELDIEAVWAAAPDGSDRRMIPVDLGAGPDTEVSIGDFTWAPDGAAFAFSARIDDDAVIVVVDADGSNPLVISEVGPGPHPTNNSDPRWSPDGSSIVWTGRFDAGNVIIAAATDGTGRFVLSDVGAGDDPTSNGSARWSPDGTRIAWRGSNEIYVADADGTDRLEISTVALDPDPTFNNSPAWAPDGTRIAWNGQVDGTFHILVADADGTDRTEISSGTGLTTSEYRPRWSHDGSRLLWEGENADGDDVLVLADADGTNAEIFVGLGDSDVDDATWSPTAPTLAWSENNVLFTSAPDGSGRSPVSVGHDPHNVDDTVWSPNGEWIAGFGFVGGVEGIVVAAADGSDVMRFSPDGRASGPIRWATDSSAVFWPHDDEDGSTILRGDIATGQVTDVLASALDAPQYVDWATPTDTHLFFEGHGDDEDDALYRAGIDGSSLERLTISGMDGVEDLSHLRVSPSGALLALSGSYRTGSGYNSGLFAIDLDARTAVEISDPATDTERASNFHPRWSPSGDRLMWTSRDGSENAVLIADPSGANRARPFPAETDVSFNSATWSPDGRRIALSRWDRETDITSVIVAEPSGAIVTMFDSPPFGLERASKPQWRPRATTPFVDVPAASFAADDITCIYGMEITTGTDATSYSPANNVTREQMAAFVARLWRALGNDCPTTPDHGFTDVPDTSFADADITCIKNLGITTGTTPTTYSPSNLVTREQMGAFIARLVRAHTES